jgi:hypothetical protein
LVLDIKGPLRKVVKEAILILTRVIVAEFNNDVHDDELLKCVFQEFFLKNYNPVFVRLVYQVLKEASDDRMNEFAGCLLKGCE